MASFKFAKLLNYWELKKNNKFHFQYFRTIGQRSIWLLLLTYLFACKNPENDSQHLNIDSSLSHKMTRKPYDSIDGKVPEEENEPMAQSENDWEFPDTIFTDTIRTRFGYRIIHFGPMPAMYDSVKVVFDNGKSFSKQLSMGGHNSLEWCNDKYLFYFLGCGSPCWGAIAINLNSPFAEQNFDYHIFSDSILNIVVYQSIKQPKNEFELKYLETGKIMRLPVNHKTNSMVLAEDTDTAFIMNQKLNLRFINDSKSYTLDLK